MTLKMCEYISYKKYIIYIKSWDEWQTAIRSHLFKNPMRIT